MTLLTKTTLRGAWDRFKTGVASAAHLRPRATVAVTATFVKRGLADLLFPPCCVGCHAEMEASREVSLCDDCLGDMELFAEPMCDRCGAPVPYVLSQDNQIIPQRSIGQGCYRCAGHKLWFDATVALGLYSGKLRENILRMKQSKGDTISLAMGRLIWQKRCDRLRELNADVVAPIPLHWRRRLAHRTNSAAVLAEVVSKHLRVPMAERLLRRSRSTVRQFDLTPPERWKNVRGAFAIRAGYHLKNAHVLLVDDVLTTGATCSEAARALKSAGAERVTLAIVARAMG